ncbi:MAG: hypothetical protein RR975_10635 [Clostridia bacterium]
MPMTRILVIFFDLPDAKAAVETVQEALSTAASPFGLRFAVDLSFEAAFEALPKGEGVPGHADMRFFDQHQHIQGVLPLFSDESHFLMLLGAHRFAQKWDRGLLSRLKGTANRYALLTGHASAAEEALPPAMFLPAFAQNFKNGGVLLERGLPLVLSAAPVRTLAVDYALLFGPTAFLTEVKPQLQTLSIDTYVAGYAAYALDRVLLWPLNKAPERRLKRPVENALPGTTLARFEQMAGFRYEQQRAGVKTTWGLFGVEDTYAQELPVASKARRPFLRMREEPMPLITTAFIDLPNPRKPIPVYILRFGFMRRIERLPVLLFTGGAQERLLRASYPNTCSYPDRAALPRSLLDSGMTSVERMQRSKLMLLLQAARKHPEFTHVAWANIDLLKHPICPQAVPNFSALMDDRIHLATVNAIPDLSFFMVPVPLLRRVAQAAEDITLLDAELKRGFAEEVLWERLVDKLPELFTLHKLPKKHLLMLTAFEPCLLSQRYQALLTNLPAPWQAQARAHKGAKGKE